MIIICNRYKVLANLEMIISPTEKQEKDISRHFTSGNANGQHEKTV